MALVCASTSCPKLHQEAYVGGHLDEQLDDQARRFLNDPTRNRINPTTGTVELSQILKWFKDDFTRDGKTLADVLAPYLNPEQVQLLRTKQPTYLGYELDDERSARATSSIADRDPTDTCIAAGNALLGDGSEGEMNECG